MPSASPPPAIYSTPPPSPDSSRLETEATLQYDSLYADVILNGDIRYDLAANGTVLPYAKLIVGYDTRSGVPGLGEVYNENAVIPAFGFRAPLGKEQYGELFLQGGYSFGLRGRLSFPETRWGFDFSRDYGSSFQSAYPHSELYGDAIAYSRFAGNIITYTEAYTDARIVPSLRTLLGADVSFDAHREYGNNYAEAYGGFLIPFSPILDLRLAGVEGIYLSRGIDVPRPASYSTFRITLSHAFPPE